jgi:hypothetical protein
LEKLELKMKKLYKNEITDDELNKENINKAKLVIKG